MIPSLAVSPGHSADMSVMNGDGAPHHAEEQNGGGDPEHSDEGNEQEVIVIQDTGFTVKIQAPGTEPFDLQVREPTRHIHSLCVCVPIMTDDGKHSFLSIVISTACPLFPVSLTVRSCPALLCPVLPVP